jgi:hypothetical protein
MQITLHQLFDLATCPVKAASAYHWPSGFHLMHPMEAQGIAGRVLISLLAAQLCITAEVITAAWGFSTQFFWVIFWQLLTHHQYFKSSLLPPLLTLTTCF